MITSNFSSTMFHFLEQSFVKSKLILPIVIAERLIALQLKFRTVIRLIQYLLLQVDREVKYW